jgi:uncharacterized membrane protein HdeD (DUF308 family)
MTSATVSREVAHRARWSVFMGVLTAAIGVAMIIYPFATATVSTVFLGSALMVAAVAQLIFAFTSETAGNFFLKLLLGVAYGIAGIALAFFPFAGVVTLTAVLGLLLVAEAVLEAVIAFSFPTGRSRRSFLISAVASLVLGLLILFQWPESSSWAIGTLVGVAVLINGITRIVIASAVDRGIRHLQPSAKAV